MDESPQQALPPGHSTRGDEGAAAVGRVGDPVRGTEARAELNGGASQLIFDGQRLGAVGGRIVLASGGFADATDRYEIRFTGGASQVTSRPSDDTVWDAVAMSRRCERRSGVARDPRMRYAPVMIPGRLHARGSTPACASTAGACSSRDATPRRLPASTARRCTSTTCGASAESRARCRTLWPARV